MVHQQCELTGVHATLKNAHLGDGAAFADTTVIVEMGANYVRMTVTSVKTTVHTYAARGMTVL